MPFGPTHTPFVRDESFRIAVVAVDVRVRLDAVPETRKRKAGESHTTPS
jgi:hypothetical protein